jgi:hypothetical protein
MDQAMTKGFKAFIPDESRERIRTYLLHDDAEATKIRGARILVSTLQTLELCFEKFSPATELKNAVVRSSGSVQISGCPFR